MGAWLVSEWVGFVCHVRFVLQNICLGGGSFCFIALVRYPREHFQRKLFVWGYQTYVNDLLRRGILFWGNVRYSVRLRL